MSDRSGSTPRVPPDIRGLKDKLGEREPGATGSGGDTRLSPAGRDVTTSSSAATEAATSAASLSPFTGKGLFTTSDAGSASGHPCDWVAVQMDPEGDPAPTFINNPAQLCYWQARPTADIVYRANQRGIPYIAQAENPTEMHRALEVGPLLSVPKALVGKPDGWTHEQFGEAVDQGWRLIAEWYFNAQPSMTAPDAGHYPYFDNVCFGIYGEGELGGEGYVEQIPLSDYLAVWGGSYSIWKAEAMTEADWLLFDADGRQAAA